MPTVARYSTQEAAAWLRQKTRTAGTPAEANGEWTNAELIVALNAAVRTVVLRMLTVPWCPYFLREEANITTVSGQLVVGAANGDQYGVIKVAYVRRANGAGGPDANKFLRALSFNRVVHMANQSNNTDGLLKLGEGTLFYTVLHQGLLLDPTAGSVIVRLFNNATELPLDVTYYGFPKPMTEAGIASGAEFMGVPIIAVNAVLACALFTMCMDPGAASLQAMASKLYDDEIEALNAAMHLHYDMPDTLVAGVNTDNT